MASAKYPPHAVITLLAASNPKTGKSALRFALYKTGITVAQYIKQGGNLADLPWDLARGLIAVHVDGQAIAAPVQAAKAAPSAVTSLASLVQQAQANAVPASPAPCTPAVPKGLAKAKRVAKAPSAVQVQAAA